MFRSIFSSNENNRGANILYGANVCNNYRVLLFDMNDWAHFFGKIKFVGTLLLVG